MKRLQIFTPYSGGLISAEHTADTIWADWSTRSAELADDDGTESQVQWGINDSVLIEDLDDVETP